MILEQINPDLLELAKESDTVLQDIYKEIDAVCLANSNRILSAFIDNRVSYSDFSDINGYGNYDEGRNKLEKIFATVLGCEDALVRPQIMSGTNAIYLTLSALLKHGDTMISLSGAPYDSLQEMIGLSGNSTQSLKANGVKYEQIELVNDDFDDEKILEFIRNHQVKLIEIQRSRGYSSRKSLSIQKCERIIKKIKEVDSNIFIMVDNCYCEFVSDKEPSEIGADVVVGSLIKNLGGGLAPNGGYVVGKKELIKLVAESLTLPGEGKEVGPSLGINRQFLEGLFLAPQVVSSALKTSILASALLKELGYIVDPEPLENRVDIVQTIAFGNPADLISYCEGIQSGSPIDSFVKPIPVDMPGYKDPVIMAAGAFIQGSSIELSCDGPLRGPYMAYQQGGITYESGKIGVLKAINEIIKKRKEEVHE